MFDQSEFDIRCEWGIGGIEALAPLSDAVIIVDVLSFSSAVDVALRNGASIVPYRWRDDGAHRFAETRKAILAGSRGDSGFSLSPASLESISQGMTLVLPSENGSTLSLATGRTPTFTACLRNAPRVAAKALQYGGRIAVIPAGERWADGALRPCVEDLIGAGAVIASLAGRRSPESELAVAAFARFRNILKQALLQCGSGKELSARGFTQDVEIAAEYGVSETVPALIGDAYVNAT